MWIRLQVSVGFLEEADDLACLAMELFSWLDPFGGKVWEGWSVWFQGT